MALAAWICIMVMAAGTMGLPFAEMATAIGAVAWKTKYHETPNWEEEYHKFLANLTNAEIADLLIHGGSWLSPFDLSRSLGLGDPMGVARAIQTGELLASLSAALAMPGRIAEGLGELASGEGGRALEAFAPRTVRGITYAKRLAEEGLRTRAGGQIVPKKQLSPMEIAAAAASVPLTKVSRAYEEERRAAIRRTGTQELKGQLVHRWAKAKDGGNKQATAEALAAIKKYNKEHRDKITAESLNGALKLRKLSPERRRLESLPLGERREYMRELRRRQGGPPPLPPVAQPGLGGPPPLQQR